MSARTSEIARICAPVKKHIRHLDSRSQKQLPELLNKVVSRLRKDDYKLIHVTKSYRKKGANHSDSFWRKEITKKDIKIVWVCTLTITFEKGFDLNFDFDFWFEFDKLLGILRADLFDQGFPYTDRSYAKKFAKKEATRILNTVKKQIQDFIRKETHGWGVHGIKSDVSERNSQNICHRTEFSVSAFPEIDELRKTLKKVREYGLKIVKESTSDIHELARKKMEKLVPFSIKIKSLEGYLAFFLCFRKPGGGFENQLYRFIYENYHEKTIHKKDIRESLLRLETHGYANVRETHQDLRNKMEGVGIPRSRRFYEIGEHNPPEKKLFRKLKRRVNIRAYLDPLPKKKLIKSLDAPDHIVNKKIDYLVRRGVLSERRVYSCRGRTVQKIKPKKKPRWLGGLERKIVEKANKHYEVQKNALDIMQDAN